MLSGLSPLIDTPSGVPQDPLRYLKWISTSHNLIILMGDMAGYPHRAKQAAVMDVTTLTFGMLASFLPKPWNQIVFAGALFCFGLAVNQLWCMFDERFPDVKGSAMARAKTLDTGRLVTLVSWLTCKFLLVRSRGLQNPSKLAYYATLTCENKH
jgi:hypothetical protein